MNNEDKTSAPSGSLREVLRVALPLIVASSGHAIRLLSDRIMLARYSQEAIAAAMPAGLGCFVLMGFFLGTAGYTNTFVAQYTGAKRHDRVGLSIWQGIWISLFGGIAIALVGELAPVLFEWMGHAPVVQIEQVRYFRILCRISAAPLALAALLSFWSGRGDTRTVMVIELTAAGLNVFLNWLLIFGHWGCPRLGILGAGVATGISAFIGLVMAAVLFLIPRNRRNFTTWPRRLFDATLLLRVLRYGAPNGVQFMLDMAAFNAFVMFMGRMGTAELEAAGMVFGLNAVAFIPMIGLGMTASILVGQGVGAGDIRHAERAVRSAMLLSLGYTLVMAALFVLTPGLVLAPFVRTGDASQQAALDLAVRCLWYVSAYLAFDAMNIVYSHAIKGAGDTRFAMLAGLSISWGGLVLPTYVALRMGASIWVLWGILVMDVMLAGGVFYGRYRRGKWKTMRVVEARVVPSEPPGSAVAIELDRG